jgi:hypothetical protein
MSNKLGKRKRKERENSAINEDILKSFHKGWYKQQPKNDRDNFINELTIIFGLMVALIWAFIDYDNPNVHKVLAYGAIMVVLLSIIRRGDFRLIFLNTKKAYTQFSDSKLSEINDAIFIKSFALCMLMILFIIDLDILSNAGIRIGAAGGVALVSVLGHVIKSFWRK